MEQGLKRKIIGQRNDWLIGPSRGTSRRAVHLRRGMEREQIRMADFKLMPAADVIMDTRHCVYRMLRV